jgi:hypothetical protein
LKKIVPPQLLATLDGWTQFTGRWWQLTPSIFLKATPQKEAVVDVIGFFKCPVCDSPHLQEKSDALVCQDCGCHWEVKDGIYNFKTPLSKSAL